MTAESPQHRGHFWRGFATLDSPASVPIVRGSGATVWDSSGQSYFDATAALWYCGVGYGRGAIAGAVAEQMRELHAYSTFGPYTNPIAERLATRLSELSGLPDPRVFFASGGSDGIETALKLVLRYWNLRGEARRQIIVSFENSYHGMHMLGTRVGGMAGNRDGYNAGRVDVLSVRVPFNDVPAFVDTIERIGGNQIAAVLGEPMQGAGGVHAPSPGFWPAVQAECRSREIPVIADEVVTGFGRLGTWFGFERYGFEPDIVVFAKQVTSGYMPLGGVIVSESMHEPFRTAVAWKHGYTYGGHASACAAAHVVLDITEAESLLAHVSDLESDWRAHLTALSYHPAIADIRVEGLACGLQIAPAGTTADVRALRLVDLLRERHVLTRVVNAKTIQLSPPLIITQQDVIELAARLRDSLDDLDLKS